LSLEDTIRSQVDYLSRIQNPDGGWGIEEGEISSPWNTAEVVVALCNGSSSPPSPKIKDGVDFLVAAQSKDGGWPSRSDKSARPRAALSRTVATSWGLRALTALVLDPNLGAPIGQAKDWLIKARQPSGAWKEHESGADSVTATSHALLALLEQDAREERVHSATSHGIRWLASQLTPDGEIGFVVGSQPAFCVSALVAHVGCVAARQGYDINTSLRRTIDFVRRRVHEEKGVPSAAALEEEDVGTFRRQYEHFPCPLVLSTLVALTCPPFGSCELRLTELLRRVSRQFWKLQKPGRGCACTDDGRRTTWATAHWILAARRLKARASDDPVIARALGGLGRPEQALVMKGGGVKGLALTGALLALEEKGYSFDIFAGTSAGAITAVLLAAGYSPKELEKELLQLDFSTFLDSRLQCLWNVLRWKGLHSGDPIRDWIAERIENRTGSNQTPLEDLPRRAVIFATIRGGTVLFDSDGNRKDTQADFAVRCSMSIPGFFRTDLLDGEPVYDGGLLNNFPVDPLLETNRNLDFIGLYLKEPRPTRYEWLLPLRLFRILIARDERALVERHQHRIISIDPAPIRTTQFKIYPCEKDFLLWQGRAAALAFVKERDPSLVTDHELRGATERANKHHKEVVQLSRRRLMRRASWWVAGVAIVCCLSWAFVLYDVSRTVQLDGSQAAPTPSAL
jgi:predicted acylesterase/phospholipase RssA